jgi:ADP-dependent NAD(P)H-hydrate dehydratase / NAD(P)H-hydrate epimerase
MMETISCKEMCIADANSEWFDVPAIRLMENAGRGVAELANKMGNSFVVICGPGNNGGDGFACARYLKSKPKIFFFSKPKSEESITNLEKAGNYKPLQLGDDLSALEKAIDKCDVIIDALFGTGVSGKIREPYRSVIELMNSATHQGKKTLSIDIPSGMDPDTGDFSDICVNATATATLHLPKQGLNKAKGKKTAGKITVIDIGIPPKVETYIGIGDVRFRYPRRDKDTHKGQSGRVLVIGGNTNYSGAPYFALMAAMRAGCDLIYSAAPAGASIRIASMAPEVISLPLMSKDFIKKSDARTVLVHKVDVICIGNGLGERRESIDAATSIIKSAKKPIVIDGDALKAVKPLLSKLSADTILPPHAGEFKEIFGVALPNELPKRVEAVIKAASKTKATLLVKGHVDIIAQGSRLKLNETGNPYMSKGGTGDILAGFCAGLMAQGMRSFDAACVAAFVVGMAGELAYISESASFMPRDVLDNLGDAMSVCID